MCVLFLCSTYMQLINAIQLKRTVLKTAHADIIINDHSRNSKEVAKRLEETALFDRVKWVSNKEIMFKQTFFTNISDVISVNFGNSKKFRKMLWDDIGYYNKIYFYNMDLLLLCIWDIMVRNGRKLPQLIRFEEGVTGYPLLDVKIKRKNAEGMRMKLTKLIRKVLQGSTFHEYINTYSVYFPEIFQKYISDSCKDNYKIEKIPFLSSADKETVRILNHVFSYKPEEESFPWKFIYLASSMDYDGAGIGEYNLVCRLAECVGKENILVKMHPRDTSMEYEEAGFAVSRNSAIPWELILLNNDFTGHVFASLSSSSMITGPAMLGSDIESYFLYPLVNLPKREIFKKTLDDVDNILNQFHESGICKKCIKINNMEIFRRQGN